MMYINLIFMINVSYWDKIVKQLCYIAKICDSELNKKHIISIATWCT